MGTAQYLSPEQAQGHAVSAGSDLYSIGVVLYEMLTGRVPFDAESAVTIALKHVSEAPPADDRVQPGGPARARAGRDVGAEQEPRRPPGQRRPVHHRARAGARPRSSRASADSGPRAWRRWPAWPPAATRHSAAAESDRRQRHRRRGTDGYDVADDGSAAARGRAAASPPAVAVGRRSCSCCWSRAAGWRRICSCARSRQTVPGVVGEDLNTARTQLQNAGFTVGAPIHVTSQQKAGIVIAQDPQGGTKAKQGSTVSLTVSSGPGTTAVPTLVGETLSPGQVVDRDREPRGGQGRARIEHSSSPPAG